MPALLHQKLWGWVWNSVLISLQVILMRTLLRTVGESRNINSFFTSIPRWLWRQQLEKVRIFN